MILSTLEEQLRIGRHIKNVYMPFLWLGTLDLY